MSALMKPLPGKDGITFYTECGLRVQPFACVHEWQSRGLSLDGLTLKTEKVCDVMPFRQQEHPTRSPRPLSLSALWTGQASEDPEVCGRV